MNLDDKIGPNVVNFNKDTANFFGGASFFKKTFMSVRL